MTNNIVVSTPPHLKSKRTTKGIMLDVIIALLPAAICGIVFFGYMAAVLYAVAVLGAVATEFVYYFIAKGGFENKCKNAGLTCKKWLRQFDYTSVITGLILAMIVPVGTAWYEMLIGSIFSIAIVKMLFGGTGKNLVNPAACGRVFMMISFAAVSAYTAANVDPLFSVSSDLNITSGATFLSGAMLLPEGANPEAMNLVDLLLGTGLGGCLGETCKVAILLGYGYLVLRKVIKWWQPLLYVVVTGLLTVCLNGFDFTYLLPSILSGGLIFGAVFMATDYVTSPKGVYGQITYYVALGVFTALLRHYTHIEVVSFAILFMNLIVPLIDTYIVRKPFGYVRQKKEGK